MLKLIEMVVDDQVTVYMDENHIHELFQSVYKKFHSTDTAMVHIKNDLLNALDDGNTILVFMFRSQHSVRHGRS